MKDPGIKAVVAALVAIASLFTLTITVADGDGDGRPEMTVTVNEAKNDGAPEKKIVVPESAVDQAERALLGHDNLEQPPEGAPGVEAAERAAEKSAAKNPLTEAGATSNQRGCLTAFGRNQSSRNGVRPNMIDLHLTAGPNRPGTSDVDAYTAMADNPSTGVSWHYVIDREGNCRYNVPEDRKAWTQAAHNPFAIGIEVVNSGSEGSYMDSAGYRKLALVTGDISRRWGIPIRLGAVSGCVTTRSGVISHQMLGLCGGGHVDISPYSITDTIKILQRLQVKRIGKWYSHPKAVRVPCWRLGKWRRAGSPRSGRAVNSRRKRSISRRGYRCHQHPKYRLPHLHKLRKG